jgi:hypothetical protein
VANLNVAEVDLTVDIEEFCTSSDISAEEEKEEGED